MLHDKYKKGFSLIELLVVITIIFIMTGMSIAAYNKFTQYQKLDTATKKVDDIIELTRKKAISSDLGIFNFATCSDFRGYRVTIGGNNISFFINCNGTYTSVAPPFIMETNINFPNCAGSCTVDYKPLTAEVTLSPAGFASSRYIRIRNSALGATECNTLTISGSGIVTITNKTVCT